MISKAAAAGYAAGRLLYFRMVRQFPLLFSYVVSVCLYAIVGSALAHTSKTYFWVFMIVEPFVFCVAALSVREIFTLIFRDYPALRTGGRWTLYVALALSIGVSLLLLRAPWAGESRNDHLLFYELAFDRMIHFTLTMVIVMQMYILSHYPLRLDRNVYVVSGFFSVMFLAQSGVRLVDSLSPHLFVHEADYGEVIFSGLCFVGWGMMLRSSTIAAARGVRTRVQGDPQREAELLLQLESLNAMLSRSGRR
jgi:hypothetical protein